MNQDYIALFIVYVFATIIILALVSSGIADATVIGGKHVSSQ